MYISEKQNYRFDDVEVDISRGCLLRAGEERHLRQKAFQVLVYMLEHRERLVSKDELFQNVWSGTAVTDDVLVQCVTEIRRIIGDDPHRPRYIKTVPKAGYRFIAAVLENSNGASYTEEITRVEFEFEEEVETDAPMVEQRSAIVETSPPRLAPGFFTRYFVAASMVLICAAGAAIYFSLRPNSQSADVRLPQIDGRKTVAVMFFENQSNTPELEWLREGLADMLITNLSRSEKLTVLSRGQLHLLLERTGYKTGTGIGLEKAREVARKSGADTVILGSFASLGEKMRLDVRLHDAQTGDLQIAESLTVEKTEQILTHIDLLSLRLARRLDAGNEAKPAILGQTMTNNLEAYRYYSLALEKAQGLNQVETLELLEKAISLDPEFAMAHARIGHTYAVTIGRAEQARPHLMRAFELSARLTEKDRLYILGWYAIANLDYPSAIGSFREIINRYPTDTEAYIRLGYLLRGEEKSDEAVNVLRQGLAIDPESAALYNALGLVYSVMGNHAEAIATHERYVALAPNEPNAHDSLGMSYQWAGRYAEAIAEYNRAIELNPKFEIAYVHTGVAHFQTGRYAAAIDWFQQYTRVAPSKLDGARGYAYIAHVFRKKQDLGEASLAARRASENNDVFIWDSLLSALDRGDRETARKLEGPLFAETKFSNRGSRGSLRTKLFSRGYISFKDGHAEEALEKYRQALRHPPPTWDIDAYEDCLANAYLEIGRYDEGIAEYERILRLNPNYPLAHFHMAEAYRKKGANEDARASYTAFLEIWKGADADIPETVLARKFLETGV